MDKKMTCPACGQMVPAAKFCVRCGSPLPSPLPPDGCIVDDDPWDVLKAEEEERARREAEEAARREAEDAARRDAEEAARREAKEAARRQAEEDARLQRAYQEAAASEKNVLNKLVYLTREEARMGCIKSIELEDGRVVSVNIPAGVNFDSHVEILGEGRLDQSLGVRGILRLSFMITE